MCVLLAAGWWIRCDSIEVKWILPPLSSLSCHVPSVVDRNAVACRENTGQEKRGEECHSRIGNSLPADRGVTCIYVCMWDRTLCAVIHLAAGGCSGRLGRLMLRGSSAFADLGVSKSVDTLFKLSVGMDAPVQQWRSWGGIFSFIAHARIIPGMLCKPGSSLFMRRQTAAGLLQHFTLALASLNEHQRPPS